MALDFLPFSEGTRLTPDLLNELVDAIRNGSIFSAAATNTVASTMATMGARTTGLEARVTALEARLAKNSIREQFVLAGLQTSFQVSKVPMTDSEMVTLNGIGMSKSDTPLGYVGDYSISNRTFTFNTEIANEIQEGDVIVVVYDYEVE